MTGRRKPPQFLEKSRLVGELFDESTWKFVGTMPVKMLENWKDIW
jgi:hypothetical protein